MMHLNDEQLADVASAVHLLPLTCRYHGLKFVRCGTAWTTHSRRYAGGLIQPCCDTGAEAFHRWLAGQALGWTVGVDLPEELKVDQ
jgi:hypothetical protein